MYSSGNIKKVPPTDRKRSPFVKGPIPMSWLERASKCGPSAVALGVLIYWRHGMNYEEISISTELTKRFGVSESTRRRTLRKMAAAGLIEMKITGRKRRVVLLP